MAAAQAVDKATASKVAVNEDAANNNNKDNNNTTNDDIETVFNTGRWSEMKIEKCAQLLYPNGNGTKYETMGEIVTTRIIPAIRSYYNKHKAKLLRMSTQYATNDNSNNFLAEYGIEDSVGANNGQNIKDGSGIGAEEVGVEERVTTINIIVGAIDRKNYNPSVSLTSHKDLNNFVSSFFVELKEQVQTKDKHVLVANVGTFYQDKNGHMAYIHQPYPPN